MSDQTHVYAQEAAKKSPAPVPAKFKVLVVEDDPSMITMLKSLLEEEDYEVRSGLGEAALQIARDFKPDVILLDIMMPVMDGLEWSMSAKADPALKNIPIIALSAAERGTLRTTFKNLQADSYLPKPFDMNVLLNLVHTMAHRYA